MGVKLFHWNEYHEEIDEIFNILKKEVLGENPAARVVHIGSSSIPGSLSKGDLDIFVGVGQGLFI